MTASTRSTEITPSADRQRPVRRGERDDRGGEPEGVNGSRIAVTMWSTRNATETRARFRWSCDRQEARPGGRLGAGDREQPEAGDGAEEDQRDDPGAARREPQDLGAHGGSSDGSGRRSRAIRRRSRSDEPVRVARSDRVRPAVEPDTPVDATSRAGRPAASHSRPPSPRTIAAVASVFARTHVSATTVTVRHGETAGCPVRGSTRWWSSRSAAPPAADRRARRRDRPTGDRDRLAVGIGRDLAVLGDEDPPAAVGGAAGRRDVAAEGDQDPRARPVAAPRARRLPRDRRRAPCPSSRGRARRPAAAGPRPGPATARRPASRGWVRGEARSGRSARRASRSRRRSRSPASPVRRSGRRLRRSARRPRGRSRSRRRGAG